MSTGLWQEISTCRDSGTGLGLRSLTCHGVAQDDPVLGIVKFSWKEVSLVNKGDKTN